MSESRGCKQCRMQKAAVTISEAEIRRLARQMSRRTTRATVLLALKDQLAAEKANLAYLRAEAAREHEHDTRPIDEHWTKAERTA